MEFNSGNTAMKKKHHETIELIQHETTKWVNDLLNAKAEPGELTRLKEEVAEHLGISRTKMFTNLKGNPKGKRVFSTEELLQIAEYFGADPPEGYGKSAVAQDNGRLH